MHHSHIDSYVKGSLRILVEKLRRKNPDIQAIARELMLISCLPDNYERYWLYLVDDLEIPTGLKEVLRGNDILFIGELVRKTKDELHALCVAARRNANIDVATIEKKLANRGLYLGTNFKEW